MGKTELDLTFKKVSELETGSTAIVGGDRLAVIRDGGVVTRPASDLDSTPGENVANLAYNVVSLAQLNADHTLIEGVVGKQIVISDITVRCSGTFDDLTSAIIQDEDGDAIFTMAQAQMSDDAILFKGETGVTLGEKFGTNVDAGKDVEIVVDGDDATGGTGLFISILYYLRTP